MKEGGGFYTAGDDDADDDDDDDEEEEPQGTDAGAGASGASSASAEAIAAGSSTGDGWDAVARKGFLLDTKKAGDGCTFPSHGDWVGWVGTWDDLMHGTPGQYRVRLKNNFGNSTNNGIGDCGYTGVELLPDATFVCVTYGHWDRNSQSPPDRGTAEERGRAPYILATRFRL